MATNETPDQQLYYAAGAGDIERMETALSNGTDINWSGLDNWTPLHVATLYNSSDVVQWLLSKGATVDSRNTDGWTPLILAAGNGHTQVATMLLEKGADVAASTVYGGTALDYAEGQDHSDTATILRVHSAFRYGLTDGYVSLVLKKLVLMGPPNVGKTAFEALLFNWPAPRHHHSTAIASRPVRAIERITDLAEGKVWDVVEAKEILKMLSDAISDTRKEDQSTGVSSSDGSHHSISKSPSLETESLATGPVDSTGPHDDETTKHKLNIDNIMEQKHTKEAGLGQSTL